MSPATLDPTPLIGLPADRKLLGPHPFSAVGEKYLRAAIDAAGGLPLIIPALSPPLPAEPALRTYLTMLDGLLLTGSHSNLEPHHYGQAPAPGEDLRDTARDANALALIPMALEMGLPILAVCRGFQEMNVALGGSLHQRLHAVPGLREHREDPQAPLDVQYGPAHPLKLTPDGLLARLAGADTVDVNSLHGQGIDRLAEGLVVEAVADDGLVEAWRLESAEFVLGLQWHPEWRATENPLSMAIFGAFGDACRRYRARRLDAASGHRQPGVTGAR